MTPILDKLEVPLTVFVDARRRWIGLFGGGAVVQETALSFMDVVSTVIRSDSP